MNTTKNTTKQEKYIAHIIKNAPKKPGVYKFKNEKKEIIYIGKAKSLKNRISSYFQKSKTQTVKTKKMVEQIIDIDYDVVSSELEAIMLETNLIKKHQPKYNILMKDDKNYVYIKITTNEDFPRILITRKIEKDKAKYFGPKTSQQKVKKTLKVLKKIFPYRHCNIEIKYQDNNNEKNKILKHKVKISRASIKYPCIDYHIKRCPAPCIGNISKIDYKKIIDQIIKFLEGNQDEIIKKLKEEMQKAAQDKKFEIAAKLRDKIQAIETIMESQRINSPDNKNIDIINSFEEESKTFFNVSQIRNGKLINQENFETKTEGDINILGSFLQEYYQKATDIPKETLIPHKIDSQKSIENWLTSKKEEKVKILTPQRGVKNKLLDLSYQNAENFAKLSKSKWQGHKKSSREKALQELQTILNLEKPPNRLECYDISHFSGENTVSSMVVFQNGFPKNDQYRKFRLHQDGKPNDYASMQETLIRRLKYLKPSILEKEIKILKTKKKELTKTQQNKANTHTYLTIVKNNKKIGEIQVFNTKNKKHLIEKLSLKNNKDLKTIIKKTAEKVKTKRIYIKITSKELPKYEEIGAERVIKNPKELKNKKNIAVYDINKNKTDNSFKTAPNLIIIDGGKGQLNTATKTLKQFKLKIPIISIAKREEEIFIPNKKIPIDIKRDSPLIQMIKHIRDESHRFAITYNRNLQLKSYKSSILDQIPLIGENTKMKLLKHFGSPTSIKNATMHELAQIIGKKKAIIIKENL